MLLRSYIYSVNVSGVHLSDPRAGAASKIMGVSQWYPQKWQLGLSCGWPFMGVIAGGVIC